MGKSTLLKPNQLEVSIPKKESSTSHRNMPFCNFLLFEFKGKKILHRFTRKINDCEELDIFYQIFVYINHVQDIEDCRTIIFKEIPNT